MESFLELRSLDPFSLSNRRSEQEVISRLVTLPPPMFSKKDCLSVFGRIKGET